MRVTLDCRQFVVLPALACILSCAPGRAQSTGDLGIVFTDQRGFPAADVYVTLASQDRVRQAKSDKTGKIAFTALPFQTYELEVWAASFAQVNLPNIQITTKDPMLLSVPLKLWTPPEEPKNKCPSWPVIGSVRYEERTGEAEVTGDVAEIFGERPLRDATITLTRLNGPDNAMSQAITGVNGSFEFKNVEPGKYTLNVSHRGNLEKRNDFHFWVARENVTRIGRILFGLSLAQDNCGGALEIRSTDTGKPAQAPELIPPDRNR